ncbi:MAG: Crp/Fnr family transcriptional regulator [Candidatus Angelobacter sp.]
MNTPLQSGTTNELYEMLSPELRAELARSERSMIVPEGTALIQQGVRPEHLVIVSSGKVSVTLNCERKSASLDYSEAGKVFGMRALVSGELPEVNVTCVESCSITTLPRDVFLALLKSNPEIYFAVARVLSTDLQIADRILRNNSRRSSLGHRARSNKTV